MSLTYPLRKRLQQLKDEYDLLSSGKDSLLALIDDTEISESVYNSNAIENSTLTLPETEKILLELEVSRNLSVREVFEAKNLAGVTQYMRQRFAQQSITTDLILLLHRMLLTNISDDIAGRFRITGEYVRVGNHIAPAPEQINQLVTTLLVAFQNLEDYFLDRLTKFHLQFEHVHPFVDGNGRIGRVLLNWQLRRLGFPPIIIRNKEKHLYYQALQAYDKQQATKPMEKVIYLALAEALHKRLTYLKGQEIIPLADYARLHELSAPATFNAARRQNLPAFRERGVWKVGK